MYTNVNFVEFTDRFKSIRPENFSYDGLQALFNYFEEIEDDIGEKIELDVIGICCDFSEYENEEKLLNDYSVFSVKTLEELRENTLILDVKGGGYIIQEF